jgi:predicted dehydrogenase
MSTVRIGVVGTGAIAQMAHLPALSKVRGAQLVALCDNDQAKARSLADRFEVPDVFTDIEELLDYDALDAVVIATPNHLHEPHVLRALAAKVHVMCERPLALTSRGVERILAAAQRADCKVVVANNHRFRTDVQALDRFLRGGELGKLLGFRAGSYQLKRVPEHWRTRRAEAGGGVFMEHGIPLLDLALWLADYPEPSRVVAHMERGKGAGSVEEQMIVQLFSEQGPTISLDLNGNYVGEEDRWWFETVSTRGSTRLSPLRVVKELNGRPVDVSPTGAAARESAFVQSYRAQLAHFLAVLNGDAKYEPPNDQVVLHRVAEAIYKSADEEKEIRL